MNEQFGAAQKLGCPMNERFGVLLQTLSRGRGSAKIGSVERGRYDE